MIDKKAEIFNAGRELFFSKGFKDTNISDITKLAGVGVGTFYNYYESKEKLFFEIFMKESEKHKRFVIESLDLNEDPVTVAKKLVALNVGAMNSNRILKEWNNRELSRELEQHFLDENKRNGDFFQSFYIEVLRKWKAEGKIRSDVDDGVLLDLFNILEYIDTHKVEIGIRCFPQSVQFLGEFIMRGLTDCQNK